MRPGLAPPERRPGAGEPAPASREIPEARLRIATWMFGALAAFLILGTAAFLLWAALLGDGRGEIEEIRAAWPPEVKIPAGSRRIRWEGVELSLPQGVLLTRGAGFLKVEFPGRCAPHLRRIAFEPAECLSLTLRRLAPGGKPPPGEGRPMVVGELRGSWWFSASWAPANYRVWELRAWIEGPGVRRELEARGHHLSSPPRRAFEAEIWPIFLSLRPAR